MKCDWVRERLLLDASGELTPGEVKKVDTHLARCQACMQEAEDLYTTQELLETTYQKPLKPPRNFDFRVMHAVRHLPASRRAWFMVLPLAKWKRSLMLTSAFFSLLLVGYGMGYWQAYRHLAKPAGKETETQLARIRRSKDLKPKYEVPKFDVPRRTRKRPA